jgi:hypothetical protein
MSADYDDTESTYFDDVEKQLRAHKAVDHLSEDYTNFSRRNEPGEEHSATQAYFLHLTADAQATISTELANSVDNLDSDTLQELQNYIELELGGSPGEYYETEQDLPGDVSFAEAGVLAASFTYYHA